MPMHTQRTRHNRARVALRAGVIATVGVVMMATVGACGSSGGSSSGPIKLGFVGALTGPNSAPGTGFLAGIQWQIGKLNNSGGVKGRKLSLVVRDTGGEPTKGVSEGISLITQDHVVALFGPTNSGVGLAEEPATAQFKVPQFTPDVLDQLMNPSKYPYVWRVIANNHDWIQSATKYLVKVQHKPRVAILADTTGYGAGSLQEAADLVKEEGGTVTYSDSIDPSDTNVAPYIAKAKSSGAEGIEIWSDSTGLISRVLNARGSAGWNAPVAGHPAMGSGDVKGLLDKPGNWDNVYVVNFKPITLTSSGEQTSTLSSFLNSGIKDVANVQKTDLWWLADGADWVNMWVAAQEKAGSPSPEAVQKLLNEGWAFDGVLGRYQFSQSNHNTYPTSQVVMVKASSFKDGTYALAPGYGPG